MRRKHLLDLLEWEERQGGFELTCGTGRVTNPLAENGYEVLDIDVRQIMVIERLATFFNQ